MAMDVFQIRLDCIALVKKLNASQQAIAKVVDFAVKYASVAADDVWDCIISECEKASLNTKLNILFLLDALLLSIVDPVGYSSFSDTGSNSAKIESQSTSSSTITASTYLTLASRDLNRIVNSVVPKEDWDAVRMNATDTQKVLSSWKRVGMFDLINLDINIDKLQSRKEALSTLPSSSHTRFSKQDTLRRIEEDRERHKRLRERVWILPAKSFADSIPQRAHSTNNKLSLSAAKKAEGSRDTIASTSKPDALTIEFDDMWESVSDLNEDDYDKMQDIDRKWWGSVTFYEKQLAAERERSLASQSREKFERTDERKRRRSEEIAIEEHTPPPRKYKGDEDRWDHSYRIFRDDKPFSNRWRKIGSSHRSEDENKSFTPRGSYENHWKKRNNNSNKRNRW